MIDSKAIFEPISKSVQGDPESKKEKKNLSIRANFLALFWGSLSVLALNQ